MVEDSMNRWGTQQQFRSFGLICFVLVLNLAAGFQTVLRAQTISATLSGTVRDSNGAVVPNVAVTVSNKATGLKRQTTTGEGGLFTLPLLPPGAYSLRAEREGFAVIEIENIDLPVAGQVSHDVVLTV